MPLKTPHAIEIRPPREDADRFQDKPANREARRILDEGLRILRTPVNILVEELDRLDEILALTEGSPANRTEAENLNLDVPALKALAQDLRAVIEKHESAPQPTTKKKES